MDRVNMCGFLGIISAAGRFSADGVRRALNTMARRGPDDSDLVRLGAPHGREIWLGHRRLSILDLSAAGRQPMRVAGPRHSSVGVCNGELYNYLELRRSQLPDEVFHSASDSEVLLHGLQKQGPDFLKLCNGMFAVASFDETRNTLLLARDRLGKKPLYVWSSTDCLAFASSLAALAELGLSLTLDPRSLAYYRWLGYIPAQLSVYAEVRKFPAASAAVIDLGAEALPRLEPKPYWDPFASMQEVSSLSYSDAISRLLELVDDATRLRLRADVPVGAFLSGGIDSTLVLSSVAMLRAKEVTAFTVKPDDPELDESEIARRSCQHLGIRSVQLELDARSFERQRGRIVEAFDEPFSDSSQVPTLAVAEAARKYAPVVLTGDGGDEPFLGYPWFAYPERMLRGVRWLGRFRRVRARLSSLLNTRAGLSLIALAARSLRLNAKNANVKRDIARYLLSLPEPEELYDVFLGCRSRAALEPGDSAQLASSLFRAAHAWYPEYGWGAVASRSIPERLAALDLVTFLRDDVLVKVDRATMFYGLEARSPLLDHRIVEFGLSLPLEYKLEGRKTKRILRDALDRRLPTGVAALRKRGFGAPLPEDLPSGPSLGVRWNRSVEDAWMSHHWGPKAAASVRPPLPRTPAAVG